MKLNKSKAKLKSFLNTHTNFNSLQFKKNKWLINIINKNITKNLNENNNFLINPRIRKNINNSRPESKVKQLINDQEKMKSYLEKKYNNNHNLSLKSKKKENQLLNLERKQLIIKENSKLKNKQMLNELNKIKKDIEYNKKFYKNNNELKEKNRQDLIKNKKEMFKNKIEFIKKFKERPYLLDKDINLKVNKKGKNKGLNNLNEIDNSNKQLKEEISRIKKLT